MEWKYEAILIKTTYNKLKKMQIFVANLALSVDDECQYVAPFLKELGWLKVKKKNKTMN